MKSKMPLNFVNNFSALAAEDRRTLRPVEVSGAQPEMRREVNELTSFLKDNLEKVVQHGKGLTPSLLQCTSQLGTRNLPDV
jgi:two-component system, NtrC family, sensor kinase